MDFKIEKAFEKVKAMKKAAWDAINADQDSEEAEELFGDYLNASNALQKMLEDLYGKQDGKLAYMLLAAEM